MIQDYGFRLYNPAIAKFLSVDPLAPQFPFYTPYQFAGNGPIINIDLDGLEPHNVTAEDGSVIKSSVEEKNIATVSPQVSMDQSVERYGYNGTWEQYQEDYPQYKGMHHADAQFWYERSSDRKEFDAQVEQWDKEERERIATEKLLAFATWFEMIGTTVAPGSGVVKPNIPRIGGSKPFGGNAPKINEPFKGYQPGENTVFSGVVNVKTGKLTYKPSGETTMISGRTPSDIVKRNQGHLQVLKSTRGSFRDNVAVTMHYRSKSHIHLSFKSSSVTRQYNRAHKFGRAKYPNAKEQQIIINSVKKTFPNLKVTY